MDYTTSNAFVTDVATGNRLHQQSAAVTTAVEQADLNGLTWEAMAIIKAAGLTPAAFDKATVASYTQLLQALSRAGVFATPAAADNSTRAATTAFVKAQGWRSLNGIGYSTSTVLTVGELGRGSWYSSGNPGVLTLPLGAAPGDVISIYCLNIGSCTVEVPAGGGIFARGILGAGNVVLQQGDSVTLTSSGVNWVQISTTTLTQPAVEGQFRNLKASASGASAAVVATADQLVVQSSSGGSILLSNVNVTASVAAAAGLGGVDTGATAANTWYAMWVVSNGTTTGMVLSLSATAPTMPATMTHKARVGWIRTDGSGSKFPLGFIQFGRKVRYKPAAASNLTVLPAMASGVFASMSPVAWANFAPSTTASLGFAAFFAQNATGGVAANSAIAYAQNAVSLPYYANGAGNSSAAYSQVTGDVLVESPNIFWQASGSIAGGTSVLACIGWEDTF